MDIQRALTGIYNRTRAHDSNVAAEAVKRNRHLTYDFFSPSLSHSLSLFIIFLFFFFFFFFFFFRCTC